MFDWVLNSPLNILENKVISSDTDTIGNSLFLVDCSNAIPNGEIETIKIIIIRDHNKC